MISINLYIKNIIVITTDCIALSLIILLSPPAEAASSSFNKSRINWLPCTKPQFKFWFEGRLPTPMLECARMAAPLIYSNRREAGSSPPRRRVSLAITRLPATGRKQGSLVIITGGPGMSGIIQLLDPRTDAVKRLRESYDIIRYDPRGVGQSTPKISCASYVSRENALVVDDAGDRAMAAYVEACIKTTGRTVLEHIGTNEAVDDLDLLRRQLGEEFLTAIAYSYGTQVAALYAERYPGSVRAIVLDGVVDLAEDWQTMRLNQQRGYQNTFERFVSFCNLEKSCPFKDSVEKTTADFHRLLQAVDNRPFSTTGGYRVTTREVLAVTTYGLLWKTHWPTLGEAFEALSNGKADKIKELAETILKEDEIDASVAITCADSASPTKDRQERIARAKAVKEAAPYANYNPDVIEINVCDMWPFAGKLSARIPTLPDNLPALLFVAQKYDPTTPHINARRMADYFRSPLVSKNADGHTLVLTGSDKCVDQEVTSYLLKPTEPRQDKACD